VAGVGELGHDGDRAQVQGDPTEIALLVAERKLGLPLERLARSTRLSELPFDADRKLMTVIDRITTVTDHVGFGGVVQFTKGAPDVLLDRCSAEHGRGGIEPLADDRRAAIAETFGGFADRGLRTLGAAYRALDGPIECDQSCERDLVWLGLVGIADPPRREVEAVLRQAAAAGIAVDVVTGDHPRTAVAVADQVGLGGGRPTAAARLTDVDWDDSVAVDDVLASSNVFARVTPEDKLRLVRAFQQRGHVVAMTGDGVNDAPALRQADIGVAMGGIGTDVSREAADMILTDDDFGTIVTAIEEGRHIFADIRKFLRYLLGSNTGEVLVMVIGVLLAAPLGLALAGDGLAVPLLATQILWINLLTDSTLALALGVDQDVDDVMSVPPRRLDDPIVDGSMWLSIAVVGVTTALAGLVALDLELAGGLLGGDGDLTTARTMVFTTLVLAQVVNAFNSRSDTASATVRIFDNRLLWLAAATTVLLQIAVVHVGVLNRAFDTVALDAGQWLTCSLLAISVLAASEVRKWAGRRAAAAPLSTA
ncbi:MAG: cation-transporting P-type ATPase, partial [Ilumatobacter sp.]|nr:cation-transporting P-type ATPase [Ilumatobacter sp.]